jgi:hypothetical protein
MQPSRGVVPVALSVPKLGKKQNSEYKKETWRSYNLYRVIKPRFAW